MGGSGSEEYTKPQLLIVTKARRIKKNASEQNEKDSWEENNIA
jgi:uncharacterized protein YfaT (DUF1175 family)